MDNTTVTGNHGMAVPQGTTAGSSTSRVSALSAGIQAFARCGGLISQRDSQRSSGASTSSINHLSQIHDVPEIFKADNILTIIKRGDACSNIVFQQGLITLRSDIGNPAVKVYDEDVKWVFVSFKPDFRGQGGLISKSHSPEDAVKRICQWYPSSKEITSDATSKEAFQASQQGYIVGFYRKKNGRLNMKILEGVTSKPPVDLTDTQVGNIYSAAGKRDNRHVRKVFDEDHGLRQKIPIDRGHTHLMPSGAKKIFSESLSLCTDCSSGAPLAVLLI